MKTAMLILAVVLPTIVSHAQAPAIVQDINPGPFSAQPGSMVTWHNKMYFMAADSVHGRELWSYDEVSPAQMVLDFNPGKGEGIAGLCVFNDKLYFSGNSGSGYEVYSYDGSHLPTKLTSLWPDVNSGPPAGFTVAGGKLFFAASHHRPNDPGRSDKRDLFCYNGTDTPRFYAPTPSSDFGLMPAWLIEYNSRLYFSGATTTQGPLTQLYELDPANDSIRVLHDVAGTTDKAYHFFAPLVFSNKLYFQAYHVNHITGTAADTTTDGNELHSWDGHTVHQLTDLRPGIFPGIDSRLGSYKGAIYFGGWDTSAGYQLWQFNPATAVANRVCIVNPAGNSGSPIGDLIEYGSALYFVGYTAASGYELWQYGLDGCGMLLDIFPGKYSGVGPNTIGFHIYNSHLYFAANDSVHGIELWRIGGTTGIRNVAWNGSVQLYPNPARENTTLQISLPEAQRLQVSVMDVNGKPVFETRLRALAIGKTEIIIPAQAWPGGTYFYRVGNDHGQVLHSGSIIHE